MKFLMWLKQKIAQLCAFFEERKERRLFYEVYYVNGSEELPPPLGAEDEKKYLQQLEDGVEVLKSRNVLVEHNLRLVVYIAKKFENSGVGMEDLVSIGTIGLIKAITSFR